MSNINVELVLATRYAPETRNGLITFLVEVPQFVWCEMLTHKRLARNASSSRAESVKRHVAHGYYTPDVFHEQGTFMQGGKALPQDVQAYLRAVWDDVNEYAAGAIQEADAIVKEHGFKGWAKQEANRLLPTTKMVRGVVTGTEDAWACFLKLRNHATADTAMQEFAREIADVLEQLHCGDTETFVWWNYGAYHVPFYGIQPFDLDEYKELAPLAAARLARVSTGKPAQGQRPDAELAQQLLADGHYSPFEHVARWVDLPAPSALCSKIEDCHEVAGWQNYRAEIEHDVLTTTATQVPE